MTEKSVAQSSTKNLFHDDLSSSQVARLKRAIKKGRLADWIIERINGIEPRRALTDALMQAFGYVDPKGNQSSFIGKKLKEGETPEGKFIEAETSYIYGKLGISREAMKSIKKGVKRDHFDVVMLKAVALAEHNDALIWAACVEQKMTREKAKQARTEMLNRLAAVQQFTREFTGKAG